MEKEPHLILLNALRELRRGETRPRIDVALKRLQMSIIRYDASEKRLIRVVEQTRRQMLALRIAVQRAQGSHPLAA